jgi:hypothetical protein
MRAVSLLFSSAAHGSLTPWVFYFHSLVVVARVFAAYPTERLDL